MGTRVALDIGHARLGTPTAVHQGAAPPGFGRKPAWSEPGERGQIYQRRAGRFEAEEAKNKFTCFREEILSLVREKGRMMATLANARGRLQVAIDGRWIDAEKIALDSVREHIGCMSTGGRWRRSPATDSAHRLGGLLRSGF